MREALRMLRSTPKKRPDFALMFSCIGRGPLFYGNDDRDLLAFRERFPGVPLLGAYGSGQIAPVGGKSAVPEHRRHPALRKHPCLIRPANRSASFFCDAWKKHQERLPLVGAEVTAADIAARHPEYHALLADSRRRAGKGMDTGRRADESLPAPLAAPRHPRAGQHRPATRHPRRLRACARMDPHDAEHILLECLGETIWRAQRQAADGRAGLRRCRAAQGQPDLKPAPAAFRHKPASRVSAAVGSCPASSGRRRIRTARSSR
jgi:hypothetical protein